jgi:DNA-binding NarL/FixJ family response regulator
MIRILLADDHAMVRAGLRQVLESQPDMRVIAEAQDGAEAVALALRLEPTVAILDIGLPGLDGLDALERIKARAPQIRALVLTGQEHDHYVLRAAWGRLGLPAQAEPGGRAGTGGARGGARGPGL